MNIRNWGAWFIWSNFKLFSSSSNLYTFSFLLHFWDWEKMMYSFLCSGIDSSLFISYCLLSFGKSNFIQLFELDLFLLDLLIYLLFLELFELDTLVYSITPSFIFLFFLMLPFHQYYSQKMTNQYIWVK